MYVYICENLFSIKNEKLLREFKLTKYFGGDK